MTRMLNLIAGLAAGAAAVALAGPLVLLAWIAPDLALLGAFAPEKGRLKPSAVARYNAVHSLPPAVALAVLGVVLSPAPAGLGLIWISHITLDRAMGYGLRSPAGWQRG